MGGLLGTFVYDLTIGRALVKGNPGQVPTSGMDPSHQEDDSDALVRK